MFPESALSLLWIKCRCSIPCTHAKGLQLRLGAFFLKRIQNLIKRNRALGRDGSKWRELVPHKRPRRGRPRTASPTPPAVRCLDCSRPPANAAPATNLPTASSAESKTRPSRNQGRQSHPEKESWGDGQAFARCCGKDEPPQGSRKHLTTDTSNTPLAHLGQKNANQGKQEPQLT
jgi:hypothetical protein